jgi:hypothetical protein
MLKRLLLPPQFKISGGAERVRTDDPRLAKPVLYQLSYCPRLILRREDRWWAWVDSNHRPYAYQAYALTT